MKTRKKRNGLFQAGMALLALYAVITLIPGGVYLAVGSSRAAQSSQAVSQLSKNLESTATPTPSPTPESLLGFLDTPSHAPESETETFLFYDKADEQEIALTIEELLPGAVACEMDLSAPVEALKAQAVACYTLFKWKQAQGLRLSCDSAQWLVWTSREEMEVRWGANFEANYAVLQEVVEAIQGWYLAFKGEPAMTTYFAISGGATETAGNVWQGDLPYLQAVASPGDAFSEGYLSTAVFTQEEVREKLTGAGAVLPDEPEDWFSGLVYSPSGYVIGLTLDRKEFTGTELRELFSLRSACFQASYADGGFTFTVRGWGHGVGMSQAGACFLAGQGMTYREILERYYPGTTLANSP